MSRLRRKDKKAKHADLVDNADLSDSEHAWWAARSRLTHTYGYAADADAVPEPAPPAQNPWSFEEVFQTGPDGDIEPEPEPSPDTRSLAEVFVEESAYRTLGLEPGATWEAVVVSHRRLAKRFHPDRLIGADPEARADGEHKMREANAAYEKLRKQSRIQTIGLFGP